MSYFWESAVWRMRIKQGVRIVGNPLPAGSSLRFGHGFRQPSLLSSRRDQSVSKIGAHGRKRWTELTLSGLSFRLACGAYASLVVRCNSVIASIPCFDFQVSSFIDVSHCGVDQPQIIQIKPALCTPLSCINNLNPDHCKLDPPPKPSSYTRTLIYPRFNNQTFPNKLKTRVEPLSQWALQPPRPRPPNPA